MAPPGSETRRFTVAAAVLEKDGRVLIARRKRGSRLADKWEFPGGKLEQGETLEECLRREMREEFGVDVSVGAFVGRSLHAYPHGEIDLRAYRAKRLSGDFTLHDHEEIRWVELSELPSYDFSDADVPIVAILMGDSTPRSPGNTPEERSLLLGGIRFRYLEWGPKDARPLVLLHGTGDNACTWGLLAPRLANHFRVLALDQRGHGGSGWCVPPAYRGEDYMKDLAAFIDAIGLDSLVLVGHSMGALHASLYAALNPGRVAALVHVDIEPNPPDWNRKYLLGLYRNLPDSYESPEDYIAETARNAPYARQETLRELAASSLVFRDGRWFRTYDREILARFDTYDLTGHLADIRCPALVVRGAESRVLGREAAERMVRALPSGELAEVPRATHPAHLDNPEAFREAVMGFLARHGFL